VRFADAIGQPRAVEFLRRALASGRIGHAYLFTGPEGCGKRTLARAFAAALLCPTPQGDGGEIDSCGSCPSCRRVESDSHPDLALVEPRERRQIGREAVDQVHAHLCLKPHEAARRVLMVSEAERLSLEAANALLKTLEEPPGEAVILLTSAHPEALPATVLSRPQRVRLYAPADSLVEGFLLARKGIDKRTVRAVARAAAGSLSRAIELADRPAALAERDWMVRRLSTLGAGDNFAFAGEMMDLAGRSEPRGGDGGEDAELSKRELLRMRLMELLDLARAYFRDLAAAGAGATEGLFYAEHADAILERAGAGVSVRSLAAAAAVAEIRRAIDANVEPKTALSVLAARIARLSAREG